jgi:hypothetical protein
MKSSRVVIGGLDAATFDLIGPCAAEGKLSNLDGLTNGSKISVISTEGLD